MLNFKTTSKITFFVLFKAFSNLFDVFSIDIDLVPM